MPGTRTRNRGPIPILLSTALAVGVAGPLLHLPAALAALLVAAPLGTALFHVLRDLKRRPSLSRGMAGLGGRLARAERTAVIVLSPSGNSSFWNRGAEVLFGLPPHPGVPRPLPPGVVAAAAREDLLAEVARAVEEDDAGPARRRIFVDARGRSFEAASSLCPAGGEAALVVLDTRGSEVRAERRGRLADHLPAGIVHVDPWGRVEAVSQRFADWTGRQPESLEGMEVEHFGFLSEPVRALLSRMAVRRGYARDEVFEVETWLLSPGGLQRPARMVASARPGGGVDALFLDLSGRRQTGPTRIAPAASSEALRSKARVLFVEDNDEVRDVIAHILRSRGASVTPCATGAQALEAFEKEVCDLALFDLHLPEMDGFELCRRVREMPGGADTPIVALTAYATEWDRERAMAEGMDDFLAKPVTRADIDELLRRWGRERGAVRS